MQESADYYVCISTFVTNNWVLCYIVMLLFAVANSSSTEGDDIENDTTSMASTPTATATEDTMMEDDVRYYFHLLHSK